MKLELRYLTTTTTTKANELRGIAVPYGQLSHPIQGVGRSFREKMKPGALTYDENTVLMTQHVQTGIPLARVGAGTLAFNETKDGLEFTATLPEARADIREALERGDLSGAVSIGFYIEAGGDRWTHTKSQSMREVTKGHLSELSLTIAGAYEGARATYGGKTNV